MSDIDSDVTAAVKKHREGLGEKAFAAILSVLRTSGAGLDTINSKLHESSEERAADVAVILEKEMEIHLRSFLIDLVRILFVKNRVTFQREFNAAHNRRVSSFKGGKLGNLLSEKLKVNPKARAKELLRLLKREGKLKEVDDEIEPTSAYPDLTPKGRAISKKSWDSKVSRARKKVKHQSK